MNTHRVTIDLPSEPYEKLRDLVDSGGYASESAAIANALLELPANDISPALAREFCAAYDEDVANPEAGLSPAELHAYLARERAQRLQAG